MLFHLPERLNVLRDQAGPSNKSPVHENSWSTLQNTDWSQARLVLSLSSAERSCAEEHPISWKYVSISAQPEPCSVLAAVLCRLSAPLAASEPLQLMLLELFVRCEQLMRWALCETMLSYPLKKKKSPDIV